MTLSEIVKQLEACGFECEAGPLENNTAFHELRKAAVFETEMMRPELEKLKSSPLADLKALRGKVESTYRDPGPVRSFVSGIPSNAEFFNPILPKLNFDGFPTKEAAEKLIEAFKFSLAPIEMPPLLPSIIPGAVVTKHSLKFNMETLTSEEHSCTHAEYVQGCPSCIAADMAWCRANYGADKALTLESSTTVEAKPQDEGGFDIEPWVERAPLSGKWLNFDLPAFNRPAPPPLPDPLEKLVICRWCSNKTKHDAIRCGICRREGFRE